jgi:hypothetical protein
MDLSKEKLNFFQKNIFLRFLLFSISFDFGKKNLQLKRLITKGKCLVGFLLKP